MFVIPRDQTFLRNGAIVPNNVELGTMIHALIEERDRVVRGGGTQYGEMGFHELEALIGQLQNYRTQRGA